MHFFKFKKLAAVRRTQHIYLGSKKRLTTSNGGYMYVKQHVYISKLT